MSDRRKARMLVTRVAGLAVLTTITASGIGPLSCASNLPPQINGSSIEVSGQLLTPGR